MNAQQLEKNVYQRVRLRPVAIRKMVSTGEILPQIDDEWIISRVDGKGVELRNMRTDHVVSLPNDSVREYRKTGHLRLAAQIILTEKGIFVEPIWGGC